MLHLIRTNSNAQLAAFAAAKFCEEKLDFRGSIEFLLLSDNTDAALSLAKRHGCIDVFARFVGDKMKLEHFEIIADYYESHGQIADAAYHYGCNPKHHEKALRLWIQTGRISDAIDLVGKAGNELLTNQLIDFLTRQFDDVPKRSWHIYKLYIATKKYREAAKIALIITDHENAAGNCVKAYSIVQETIRLLEKKYIPIPRKLRQLFIILHSYQLVKVFAKRGDHGATSRLLIRVAKDANTFPPHIRIKILISTIIECQKNGLGVSLFFSFVVGFILNRHGNLNSKHCHLILFGVNFACGEICIPMGYLHLFKQRS